MLSRSSAKGLPVPSCPRFPSDPMMHNPCLVEEPRPVHNGLFSYGTNGQCRVCCGLLHCVSHTCTTARESRWDTFFTSFGNLSNFESAHIRLNTWIAQGFLVSDRQQIAGENRRSNNEFLSREHSNSPWVLLGRREHLEKRFTGTLNIQLALKTRYFEQSEKN